MTSYILVCLTFILGVIGSLFDVTQKDSDGKVLRGIWGLPRLTRPGTFSLILLTIAFMLTLVSTYRSNTDADTAKANELKVQSGLDQANAELAKANSNVTDLEKEDFKQFNTVGQNLRDTGKQVATELKAASGSIRKTVDASVIDLDQSVVGSLTPLTNLDLYLFFTQMQHLHSPGDPSSVDVLIEFKEIACKAPMDIALELRMPLAQTPHLILAAWAEKRGLSCSSDVWMATDDPSLGGLSAKAPNWGPVDYGQPCNITGYVGRFSNDNLKSFAGRLSLTAASFRPVGSAEISAMRFDAGSLEEVGDYLKPLLPRIMGFHVVPNGREDLAIQSAFAVDSYSTSGNSVYIFYAQTAVRPEWSYWDFSGIQLFKTYSLLNPYRKIQAHTGVFGLHLSPEDADLWGKKCVRTHPIP